uniref:Putative secreted protein n=1 Tax=Amblyomma americanum TaxID=6943 RepID=A0A0C9S3B8_AMBAM
MTPAKLFFTLLAACLVGMTVASSGYDGHHYGADSFVQCGTARCYINPDLSTATSYSCPAGCSCISDNYYNGVYTGWGTCWGSYGA